VSADVLRAVIAAMLHTRELFMSETENSCARAEEVFETLDFSKRCLMPWVGIGYALRAVNASHNATMLLGLVLREDMFHDMDLKGDEVAWRRVLDLAARGLARVAADARSLSGFSDMSVDILEKFVDCIEDDEWSEELEASFPVRRRHEFIPWNSPLRKDMFSRTNGKGVRLYNVYLGGTGVILDQEATSGLVRIGEVTVLLTSLSIINMASHGDNEPLITPMDVCLSTPKGDPSTVSSSSLSLAGFSSLEEERFHHGNPPVHKFLFKNQINKLHMQACALVTFYAGKLGTAPEQVSIEVVWRFFRDLKRPNLADIVRRYICVSALQITDADMKSFFQRLTEHELESIMSGEGNLPRYCEGKILRSLVEWAMHKSKQGFQIGDVVRVHHDADLVDWDGQDCIVTTELDEDYKFSLRLVQANSDPSEGGDSSQQDIRTAYRSYVYDPGQSAFIRLFHHVKIGCLRVSYLPCLLGAEGFLYAYALPCFKEMIDKLIDVQTGRAQAGILGLQGIPRHAGGEAVSGDDTNKMVKDFINSVCMQVQYVFDVSAEEKEEQKDELDKLSAQLATRDQQLQDATAQIQKLTSMCAGLQQANERVAGHTIEQLEALLAQKRGEAPVSSVTAHACIKNAAACPATDTQDSQSASDREAPKEMSDVVKTMMTSRTGDLPTRETRAETREMRAETREAVGEERSFKRPKT
jgi:hypothetical protein